MELAALVRSRAVSPVEIVSSVIDRVERSQPVLNTFTTVCAERALADARAAEQAVMRGDALGPDALAVAREISATAARSETRPCAAAGFKR